MDKLWESWGFAIKHDGVFSMRKIFHEVWLKDKVRFILVLSAFLLGSIASYLDMAKKYGRSWDLVGTALVSSLIAFFFVTIIVYYLDVLFKKAEKFLRNIFGSPEK